MYYDSDTVLYVNGRFQKAQDTRIDLYGQTLHYGLGVFEGIRAYNTVHGVKIFKATEHYDRLRRSADLAGIPFHYGSEELTQISYQLLKRNDFTNAYIRPLVFCGPNMSLNEPKEVSLMIAAWEWGKYFSTRSLRVCISSIQRPSPKSFRIEAKVTGHYVNSIMATMEAKNRGFDEALMLDCHGFVAEGPGANFFYEKDGVLYTPPLGNILPGITRNTIIDICRELDVPLEERLSRPEELFEADSAFLCGTAAEIVPIESIEGQHVNKPWKNSLGSIVQEAYQCIVMDKSYSYVIV